MEEWQPTLKATEGPSQDDSGIAELLDGNHQWYATNHARPTYCNVCRDALHGVTSHGLSCEMCKYKVHKRCSTKAINNCKWTTLSSIGKDIIEDQDGNIIMPHQWMEGNLPVSSKCLVCEKTCGSVLRLQDLRCLWCRATIHTVCKSATSIKCPLGSAKLSIVPPTALHSIGSDEAWEAVRPTGCSPLLVFVNSKSGDNQGIKFLRRFKQLLNPAQVFDLIKGGPAPGLKLFRHFDPFRILVCSGDGSVGWVLSEIDRLGMHTKQCQVGVLPLGTGNDLARVLGWGASCDDDTHLPQLLEKYEKAGTKMLDRWSIMTFERGIPLPCHKVTLHQPDPALNSSIVHEYEDSVLAHITNILQSDQDDVIISSIKALCETVKDFAKHILDASLNIGDQELREKSEVLQQKLDLLLQTLLKEESYLSDDEEDADVDTIRTDISSSNQEEEILEKLEKEITNLNKIKRRCYMEKDNVMSRANSLTRAIRSLVEHTESTIDEQNNPSDERQSSKMPNITITSDISPINLASKNQQLDLPGLQIDQINNFSLIPIIDSASSIDSVSISPYPSPNVESLSPMPDFRRDLQPERLLTFSMPDRLTDRINSENIPQGAFSFDGLTVQNPCTQLGLQVATNDYFISSELTQVEVSSDIPVTVTRTSLDTSIPSDDATMQDVITSPDTDSLHSRNISSESHAQKRDPKTKVDPSSSSCTNSIISTDSIVSDTLDSRSYTVRNSESEIGYIDSDIFDSSKKSNSLEIRHIDSPDNSDVFPSEAQPSVSMMDDLSSLGQDLISTILTEKYDSVKECLMLEDFEKIEKIEKPQKPQKFCSLARFVEGDDIARQSFKKKNVKMDKGVNIEENKCKTEGSATCLRVSENESMQSVETNVIPIATKSENIERTSDLLSPICCINISSDNTPVNEIPPTNYPPMFSVIIDPPSPSMSIKSHQELNLNDRLDPHMRQYSNGHMERLTVELPDSGFSPQATRRISSGSLLKTSELMSLTATASCLDSSNVSLRNERSRSMDKTENVKKLPIINPLVRLPMWPNVSGGVGLISQALLANADALCAAVSPLMDPDESSMEGYIERSVMNNYFGIGIDAKISLDFHHKREEHPEKCRSRAKNYIWYGVLGSKEWLQKTYKNLEQRVQLECDGQRIPLPSLQGIVVLNIPSFMGGTNFWGGTKEGDLFLAPSFDDRILEVVAVFGSIQMAASRLINLQHHRIAQCQTIQINILGEEGVPIQVDGEAWIQPPGIIKIVHKNRVQMLYRNKALETSLRTWEEKQRNMVSAVGQSTSVSDTSQPKIELQISSKPSQLNEEELHILFSFIEVVSTLVKWVKLLIISHPSLEPNLYQIASRTAQTLEQMQPDGKILQGVSLRPMVTELVLSARQLYEESCELLHDKAHNLRLQDDLENKLSLALTNMEQELRKCTFDERNTGLVYLHVPVDNQGDKKNRHRGLFWLKFRRFTGQSDTHSARDQVTTKGVQEVCITWLENMQLDEYIDKFVSHDIRDRELLAQHDPKDLGITKMGHASCKLSITKRDFNN
ncbi:LOW QUALITY PROTEIN: diacylglycerol kinase eta [Odontomachus brunneus]|uniref:LOW QUALITY PROTEIN: diacylglycerol kinase eta n=1 Tax=Odontomachus brunneus TaxID=486640 RepID=UPI0013F29EFE|nr:LOW QUALITY PROTEIN: diacylglycerol kinase eta [Odontomachus brunneus]